MREKEKVDDNLSQIIVIIKKWVFVTRNPAYIINADTNLEISS